MSILTTSRPDQALQYGIATVSFIYVFTLIYSSTFLIINFNYPAEIFPTECRSRGMAFGIMGWAIGLGAGTLYNPEMFESISGYGFFIFAGLNLVFFCLVYLFLPETSGRSLESINTLFEQNSVFAPVMERRFQKLDVDEKTGYGYGRHGSMGGLPSKNKEEREHNEGVVA